MRSSKGTVLVTGATGFLGSHFLYRLAKTQARRCIAIVRSPSNHLGQDRLRQSLLRAASAHDDSLPYDIALPTAFAGDIGAPMCGINMVDQHLLKWSNVEQVWHFASDLRYEEGNRASIWKTNVDGAINVLQLAKRLGARRFVYVSTAYTAGAASGKLREELHDIDGPFNNVYEESKCITEHLLTRECARAGMGLTILRPSIVIGSSKSKRPGGTSTGLYGFIRAMLQLKSHLAEYDGILRLPSTPATEINFIPVDHVVDDMLRLLHEDGGRQGIYHLTSTETITAKQCWNVIAGAIGLNNVILAPCGSYQPNAMERLLERRIAFFLGYINSTKRFERAMNSAWKLSEGAFREYVDAALDCQFGQEAEFV